MFPRRFTSELKAMREAGASLEESLTQLRSKGASIIECIVAVKEESGCELGEAKRVVSQSKTWRDIAEATEAMWDELITELKKEAPNQSPEPARFARGSSEPTEPSGRRGSP